MSSFLEFLIPDPKQRATQQGRARLRVHVTERLLLEMEKAGISKADLAKKAGVSRSAVTQSLSGTRNMTLNALFDYAIVLGLEPVVDFIKQLPADVGVAVETTGSPSHPIQFTSTHFASQGFNYASGVGRSGIMMQASSAQQAVPAEIDVRRQK